MFWKNTAWSWDNAADNDDAGYLLPTEEPRRTPDSTSDVDLNRITTTTGLKSSTNHKAWTNHNPTNLSYTRESNSTQQLMKGSEDGRADLQDLNHQPAVMHTIHRLCRICIGQNLPQVNVVRGQDGFGFTIFSDSPVRVQGVELGGPAHRSGLRQGDSVLQLNGLPVENWKCVDLANTIRSCSSQIVLVVWRSLPELRSGCDELLHPPTNNQTTGRKLLPNPTHSKHGGRLGQGSVVRSSLGVLDSVWKDRTEDHEEVEKGEQEKDQEATQYFSRTTTLKGTRVTSSDGDNYIFLSPVIPGGQLLQPVYHDSNGTIGRLYQTHPKRAPPSNYNDYQNCNIIQSHLPCSGYGTYVTPESKTLIFPVFVQPLNLCSPDRTLLMSEEMVLHQAHILPAKVTVLIYSDLLLFTREDKAGRGNVLQSPLYLNTLQLREVPFEPLHIYFLQSSQARWHRLFILETFSVEQRLRVSLCLHDNVQSVAQNHQLSDLPSNFGLLSLGQSDLLTRASFSSSSSDPPLPHPTSSLCDLLTPPCPSHYSSTTTFSSSIPLSPFSTLTPYASASSPPSRSRQLLLQPSLSPVGKERRGTEEERWKRRPEEMEEQQQVEGTSETLENVERVGERGFLLSSHHLHMMEEEEEISDEEEELFTFTPRPADLRRSLSEGSLLQEPRTSRSMSDSITHHLTSPLNFDAEPGTGSFPRHPSIHALKKQLTKEGGSLHHMLLLLNGDKDKDVRSFQPRKNTRNLAAGVRSCPLFLRQQKDTTFSHCNSLKKALRNNRPSTGEVIRWAASLEALLTNKYGLAVFRYFLKLEFSEENLDFWLAVERFKRTRPLSKMVSRAANIYDEFVAVNASRQVIVDSSVRESTNQGLRVGVDPMSFQLAQDQILSLMESDSYPRFLKSRLYTQLANGSLGLYRLVNHE
uniref:regulator of G-protein signaling 3-like isoform X2 n=1 Tax=Gasterosteus aculeatus aculeatus TaxID=481459 RepID=UPI001A988023|nr:regulator of G-protein signaling 3-like isoform X2 [Gasterosteus aculeatus aculeatus]